MLAIPVFDVHVRYEVHYFPGSTRVYRRRSFSFHRNDDGVHVFARVDSFSLFLWPWLGEEVDVHSKQRSGGAEGERLPFPCGLGLVLFVFAR